MANQNTNTVALPAIPTLYASEISGHLRFRDISSGANAHTGNFHFVVELCKLETLGSVLTGDCHTLFQLLVLDLTKSPLFSAQ